MIGKTSGKGRRIGSGQAAMDFMMSYGIALLIIGVAVYVVFQIGIFTPILAPNECTAASSFSCRYYSLSSNGLLTLDLSQATGGTMNITGVACSSGINATLNRPEYGNINVISETQGNVTIYSGSSGIIHVYCYNGYGVAHGSIGSTFTGYVWINYTISNLPNTMHNINKIVSFTTQYS
jgi:hypothetical protein